MGLVVLVACAPFLIPLILIVLFLGIFGDKLFPPKYHTTYICNPDGEVIDMYEDHTRPIQQNTQPEIDYDDFDDDDDYDDEDEEEEDDEEDDEEDEEEDEDDDDDDDDDWDDEDDDDDWNDEANSIEISHSTVSFVNGKKVNEKSVTITRNIDLDPKGYDCVAVIDGKTYRFNDGEEPLEVLKMIEDTKKETQRIRERTKVMVKARTEKYEREMAKLKKEEERLKKIKDGTLKPRRRDDYDLYDDECDSIVYVDDDEFGSFNSYEEPETEVASEEPMLYGGLPYGDGQIFFEDDGDAYL